MFAFYFLRRYDYSYSFSNSAASAANATAAKASNANMLENLVDIREYDVPYVVGCCIDLDIRAGQYYDVTILPDKI
jgi:DNA polymerase elongation subunit (family B)